MHVTIGSCCVNNSVIGIQEDDYGEECLLQLEYICTMDAYTVQCMEAITTQ